jgi:hypothetical protein
MAHVREMMIDSRAVFKTHAELPEDDPLKLRTELPMSQQVPFSIKVSTDAFVIFVCGFVQWYNMDEKHVDERGIGEVQVGDTTDTLLTQSSTGYKSKFHVTLMLCVCGCGDTPNERFPIPPGIIHQGAVHI